MTTPAQAQAVPNAGSPAPPNAAPEGLRRQEERARERLEQLRTTADTLRPADRPTVSDELPAEHPCFLIREIVFSGNDARRFSWLSATTRPFLGQCAGVSGLRQIAAAVDAKLLELGYATTKVALPAQNLREGRRELSLHVGRVAAVEMVKAENGKEEPDRAWGTWRNAFPVSAGDILDIRDLEQGVEQMQRLPSQAVATELVPGDEPDTSTVVIRRRTGTLGERLRGGLTLDNSGTELLGKPQLSAYAALDNPLGLNDILLLSANTNVEHLDGTHRSQSASFNYSVPWGYNTFSINRSYSRFAQTVQGTTARFLSSGSSQSTDLKWDRIVWRTSSTKTGLYGALSTRRANSFLDDVELLVQRRRTTNFETGITYRQLVRDAAIDFSLGYRRGVPWQDAQDDLPTAVQGGPTLRPTLWTFSGSYNQPFEIGGRAWQYNAALRGQYTADQTLSIDQIALGGRFSVRGFDGNSVLLAESGYFLRNELSTPIRIAGGIDTLAFLGLDAGRVWGSSAAALIGDKLAGMAVGMRGKWRAFQFEAALGTPLYKPQGFDTLRWNPYLSLTYAF
ncbi:MAG: ShlB/FhaC/HecB family hemolysin secretion/activation protein [Burkholderiaceae bacterium]